MPIVIIKVRFLLNKLAFLGSRLRKRKHTEYDSIRQEARKNLRNASRLRALIRNIRSYWFPSLGSLGGLLFFGAIIVILNSLRGVNSAVNLPFLHDDPNWRSPLKEMLLGVSGAVFALAIFVAQALASDVDRGRVLLKRTLLYPIAVGTSLMLLVISITPSDSWPAWGGVFIILVLIIRAFHNVIRLQLDRPLLREEQRILLEDRIRQGAEQLLEQRLMDNLFLGYLQEKRAEGIEYTLSASWLPRHLKRVEVKTFEGVVDDVSRRGIDSLAKWLLKYQLGPRIEQEKIHVQEAEDAKRPQSLVAYLTVRPGEYVRDDDAILIVAGPDLAAIQEKIEELEKIAAKIYTFRKIRIASSYVDDLDTLSEKTTRAIKEHNIQELRALVDAYGQVVQAFSKVFISRGIRFTVEQAQKEIHSFQGGWKPIRLLTEHIRNLMDLACSSSDLQVVREVVPLAVHITSVGIKHRDQYIFQMALPLLGYVISLAYRISNKERVEQYLKECGWRWMVETINFVLMRKLKEAESSVEIEEYKDMIEAVMRTYQLAVKEAIEQADLDYANMLIRKLGKIIDRVVLSDLERERARIELQVKFAGANLEDDVGYGLIIKKQQTIHDLHKAVNEIKLGLAGWSLYTWERELDEAELETRACMTSKLLEVLPRELQELTYAYVKAQNWKREDFWGWGDWKLDTMEEGVVHHIDPHSDVLRIYVLAFLQRLPADIEQLQTIEIDRNMDLALKQPDGKISMFLSSLEGEKERWRRIVDADLLSRVDDLRSVFGKMAAHYEKREQREIAERSVDQKRIEEFTNNLIGKWKETLILGPLIKRYASSTVRPIELERSSGGIGISTIHPKEAFFLDWPVQYIDFGAEFGRAIAGAEDRLLCQSIEDSLSFGAQVTNTEGFLEQLDKWLARSVKKGADDIILLGQNGMVHELRLWEPKQYTPTWQLKKKEALPQMEGILTIKGIRIRVFETPWCKQQQALLLQVGTAGKLIEYTPKIGISLAGGKVIDGVLVRVIDLGTNDTVRREIMDENPSWLKEKRDPEFHLRRHVLIDVRRKVELEDTNRISGMRIKFSVSTQ